MKLGMLPLFENPIGRTEHRIIKEQMEKPQRVTREYGLNEMLRWTRIAMEWLSGEAMPRRRPTMQHAA